MILAPLDALRQVILSLFPWLSSVRLGTTGGLAVRAAGGLLHLQGDAGDAGVARVGDACGRLYRDSVSGALYYSPSATAAYVVVASGVGPPLPTTAGTTVTIATGSARVTAA
jgi:hypothetical protein